MKLKIGVVLLLILSAVVFNACKKESNDVNPTTQPGNDPTDTTPTEKNDGSFKFKVKVAKDEEVKIFTFDSYTYDYQVDWGDGNDIQTNITGRVSHKFAKAGEFIVSLKGKYPGIFFTLNRSNPNTSLIAVTQWGNNKWQEMSYMFSGCNNFTDILAKDQPDLSQVKRMASMFEDNEKFNVNIGAWDVSKVEDMNRMFNNTSAFNQDISGWNVENVTNMTEMFENTSAFNQDISGWNLAKVTKMTEMFRGASAFNQDISGWNVYNVTEYANFAKDSNLECKNAPSILKRTGDDIGCRGDN